MPGVPIRQGYLAIAEETEVRLRQAGDRLTLTVKGGQGETRSETEVEITRSVFDELWPETGGRRIEKFRREINLDGGLTAEVDSYEGELEDLVVVEVEFTDEADADSFWPPEWFGRELTGDPAWANQSLATDGLPRKYFEFRLRPGEEPGSGICRVVAARAAQAAGAVRAAGQVADQAGQVHQARKSLKKARSALRLLRGVIDDRERKAANSSCREAARRLSGARDAEVKLATLAAVAGGDEVETGGQADAGRDWRRELEGEADAHRGDLTPEVLGEIARQIESVARNFRGRVPAGNGKQVARNVGRAYRRGRRELRQSRESGEAEHFHAWRKRAKDLRYQLEILEPRLPERFTELRERVEELADQLGDLHDLDVLTEDMAGRDLDAEAASDLTDSIGRARKELIDSCLALGKEIYGSKPGRLRKRIRKGLVA